MKTTIGVGSSPFNIGFNSKDLTEGVGAVPAVCFFGKEYVELFGMERLASAPFFVIRKE